MAQVSRRGPKVGSHLALLCIHRVNRVADGTINIIPVLLL